MRDEIWAGLKNAVERGATLDEAVESFIGAGYSINDVREAANSLGLGASKIISEASTPVNNRTVIKSNSFNIPQMADKFASVKSQNTLPSVSIDDGSNLNDPALSKVDPASVRPQTYYVPGSSNQAGSQNMQAQSQGAIAGSATGAMQPHATTEYIPNGGSDNTRNLKITVLVILLCFLLGIIVSIGLFYSQILDFMVKFYS